MMTVHFPPFGCDYLGLIEQFFVSSTGVIIVDFSPVVRTMYLLSEVGMLSGDNFCHAIIDNFRSSLDLNSVFIIRAWGI